ncbi:hypothetical protein WBG78_17865 [Chryseolinea sp. T2]|uniref:hypothetical protein n=1 Tax=Chryseolinea sp. T2 TaxID=3129255 RepID=UPI003077A71D
MQICKRWLFTVVLSTSVLVTRAQEADSLILSGIDDALSFEDSLSIFTMIDSLMQMDDLNRSQIAVRLSYNSNVLSAGRTLGIENFGLAPGVSYYHKSGLYADVSGYWSKDFDPSYYLTITSIGYMHSFSKYFSVIGGYDHYFYNFNEDTYIPYRNALSVTPMVDYKSLTLSFNYSFYFGDTYANRLMPGLTWVISKNRWLGLDRISFSPSAYALFGDETITDLELVWPKTLVEAIKNKKQYGRIYAFVEHNNRVFGVMNYAFTAPLSVTLKRLTLMLSYTYNIPKALPGEPLTLSESSYLSGSLTWFIPLHRNKLPLEF